MRFQINRRSLLVLHFLSVLTCSTLVGAGIGYFQGLVAFWGPETEYPLKMSVFSAMIGAEAGGVIGLLCFLLLYKRNVSLADYCVLVFVALFFGTSSTFIMRFIVKDLAWICWYVTVIVAFVGLLYLRSKRVDRSELLTEKRET